MANVSTQIIKLSNFPPLVPNVPPNYPDHPQPGKLVLLLNSNENEIYHKFSPFTDRDSFLGTVLSDTQPFVYTYIDEAKKSLFNQLPETVKVLANAVNLNQDSLNDVVRVSKFMISTWGVQFVATQFALQRLNRFDETRVYNPLSPILATVQPLTLGIGEPPTRHIEGNLVFGLLNSITSTVGINLSNGFQTPASTVGDPALPTENTGQGKGLIRGTDANNALLSLKSKWVSTKTTPFGISGFLQTIGTAFISFFGGAQQSPGIFRADETGYALMATSPKIDLAQPWFASLNTTVDGPVTQNKKTMGIAIPSSVNTVLSIASNPLGVLSSALGTKFLSAVAGGNSGQLLRKKLISLPETFQYVNTTNGYNGKTINGKPTGYSLTSGATYGDVVGQTGDGQFDNSDMLAQFSYFIDDAQTYPSKFSDPADDATAKINKTLQDVLKNINSSNTYNAVSTTISNLLPNGVMSGELGYDRLNNTADPTVPRLNKGATGEYVYGNGTSNVTRPKSIDGFVRPSPDNLRMATAFMSDGINMLGVLGSDRSTVTGDDVYNALNAVYPGWTRWEPYQDDLIAFFFYDVVNSTYIPFRATIKALSEGNVAFWDELRFIGRSDQLYSYNGFSRTLSFTFNVVINSVTELLPSWKKINYIASAVKPSNYTTGQNINQKFNRFIVPPMFMITIGDLYKYQPVVITSVNVNIPDDAAWETLNEDNSKNGWSYLNGAITSPNVKKNYGQLPREAEIAITCNVLEKERSIVGGSHFGHEPRTDDWESQKGDNRFLTGSAVYLPAPTTLHKQFASFNATFIPNTPTAKGNVEQNRIDNSDPFISTNSPAKSKPSGFNLLSQPTTAGSVLSGNPSSFAVPTSITNTNLVNNASSAPLSSGGKFVGAGGGFGGAGAGG